MVMIVMMVTLVSGDDRDNGDSGEDGDNGDSGEDGDSGVMV